MIYGNVDIHNVAEIISHKTGGITWKRIPERVYQSLEIEAGKDVAEGSTGVEIRFVIKSGDSAVLKLELISNVSVRAGLQVYYGGIQGDFNECERLSCSTPGVYTFEIKRASKLEQLKKISKENGIDWDPEVIRIIIDRGKFRLIDVEGDIEPPKNTRLPQKTILTYGSSITHGSVAIDAPHTWASYLAHSLNMDLRNLGMAGSCAMEDEFAEYIAHMGETGEWDIATLELGINVLQWDIDTIRKKAGNFIEKVVGRNPDKKIYIISPFYCEDDYLCKGNAQKWRNEIKSIVEQSNYSNVTYIDGSTIVDSMKYIASDGIHPNIYGVQRIADKLIKIIG